MGETGNDYGNNIGGETIFVGFCSAQPNLRKNFIVKAVARHLRGVGGCNTKKPGRLG